MYTFAIAGSKLKTGNYKHPHTHRNTSSNHNVSTNIMSLQLCSNSQMSSLILCRIESSLVGAVTRDLQLKLLYKQRETTSQSLRFSHQHSPGHVYTFGCEIGANYLCHFKRIHTLCICKSASVFVT